MVHINLYQQRGEKIHLAVIFLFFNVFADKGYKPCGVAAAADEFLKTEPIPLRAKILAAFLAEEEFTFCFDYGIITYRGDTVNFWIVVLVTFFAGLGAGLGTGFAGMSAAAVISPMLITFLGVEPYTAVGIALASDVLASAVSAFTYGKNKNLDIKNGLLMMAMVLLFTVVGSYVSSIVPAQTMGGFSTFMTLILGIKFIVKPVMTTKQEMDAVSKTKKRTGSILCGSLIGFICGFVGAGGGMMMLLILTSVLGYELKTAVGTSVFIMTFTALTGSISHFSFGDRPDLLVMALCILFTFIWARIAAVFANKAKPATLNRAVGIVLVLLGVVILGFEYLIK